MASRADRKETRRVTDGKPARLKAVRPDTFTKGQWRAVAGRSTLELREKQMILEARRDYWAFRKWMFPRMKRGWWQHVCAIELQQFCDDLQAGKRPWLLFEGPRQHGKTRQVVEFLAYLLGRFPDLRQLYASYSDRLGKRANRELQKILSSPRYQKVFPATQIQLTKYVITAPDGTKLPPAQRTQTLVEIVGKEGSFRNTTVLGAINGEGFDIGVLDDPLKGRTESHSEVKRETAWNWFSVDFLACMSDLAGLIVIAARRHKEDPVSKLRELAGDRLRVISFKAVATEDEPYRNAGEPLFPELKSAEFLARLELVMPKADWEATMQQNPIEVGGDIIKGDWFKRYTVLPIIKHRIIYADTAQKDKEANDYSVFQCWGLGEDGKIYLLDQIRGKWLSPELRRRATEFWLKHRDELDTVHLGKLRRMKIEDKASGTGLIQEFQNPVPYPGQVAPVAIVVEPIERTKDRYQRVLDVLGYIEKGYVNLPAHAAFTGDIVNEAEAFTADDSHAHDDQLDPMMDAIEDLLGAADAVRLWEQLG